MSRGGAYATVITRLAISKMQVMFSEAVSGQRLELLFVSKQPKQVTLVSVMTVVTSLRECICKQVRKVYLPTSSMAIIFCSTSIKLTA